MKELFGVHVDVNVVSLQQKLENLINEDVMLEIHNLFAKMCDPYVPMQEGVLSQTVEIFPDHIRYGQPYAHYQYTGEVYGPNIPIKDADGGIDGWFSPPGKKKHPTGAQLQYNKEKHPLASKEWDKAMMRDKRDEFTQQVKDILVRRAKQLYG